MKIRVKTKWLTGWWRWNKKFKVKPPSKKYRLVGVETKTKKRDGETYTLVKTFWAKMG